MKKQGIKFAEIQFSRSTAQPEVPTLREAGIPNVEIQGYNYMVAPLVTPAAVVARLKRN